MGDPMSSVQPKTKGMNDTFPKKTDIAISGVLNRSAHKGVQNFDDLRRFLPKDLVVLDWTSRDRDRVKLVDKQLGVIEKKHWTLEVTETERLISFGTRQWETPYTNNGESIRPEREYSSTWMEVHQRSGAPGNRHNLQGLSNYCRSIPGQDGALLGSFTDGGCYVRHNTERSRFKR